MKNLIKKISLKNKPFIIESVFLTALLSLAFYCLAHCFALPTEVPCNKYALRGVLFLGLSILILQRVNIKNFRSWIPVGIILILAARFFLTKEMLTYYRVYGRDIWGMWNAQWACYAVYTLILADAIFEKKIRKFNFADYVPLLLTLSGLILSGIFTLWRVVFLIIAAAVMMISVISFRKDRLEKYTYCIAIAILISMGGILVYSLIKTPYDGKGFYVGTFLNSITFAILFGFGLCSCFFIALIRFMDKIKQYYPLFIAAGMGILFSFGIIISSARTVVFGIIVPLIITLWLIAQKKGKLSLFVLILIGSFVLSVAIMIISYIIVDNIVKSGRIVTDDSVLIRFVTKIWLMFNIEYPPYILDIPRDSFLYKLNILTSGRVELWILHLEKLHILKGNAEAIVWYGGEQSNAHNTYIGYLYTYGLLPAVMIFTSWIWGFVRIIRKLSHNIKRQTTPEPITILALLILAYNFTIFLNEVNQFNTITVVLQMLLISLSTGGDKEDSKITQKARRNRT